MNVPRLIFPPCSKPESTRKSVTGGSLDGRVGGETNVYRAGVGNLDRYLAAAGR
jgi:hypothetical protein